MPAGGAPASPGAPGAPPGRAPMPGRGGKPGRAPGAPGVKPGRGGPPGPPGKLRVGCMGRRAPGGHAGCAGCSAGCAGHAGAIALVAAGAAGTGAAAGEAGTVALEDGAAVGWGISGAGGRGVDGARAGLRHDDAANGRLGGGGLGGFGRLGCGCVRGVPGWVPRRVRRRPGLEQARLPLRAAWAVRRRRPVRRWVRVRVRRARWAGCRARGCPGPEARRERTGCGR